MNQKFSDRIQALVNLAPGPYEEVWDICCDLGKIGLCYSQRYTPPIIHFVDQVAPIIQKLKLEAISYIPKEVNAFTHIQKAENLKIKNNKINLFILAGIGSETIIKILDNFEKQNLFHNDFLISTHKYPHKIRQYLIHKDFKLIKEQLVIDGIDGKHFYEMLLVSNKGPKEISMTGQEMWDFNNPKHLAYLDRQVKYNEIKAKYGDMLAKLLLDQFHNLVKTSRTFR